MHSIVKAGVVLSVVVASVTAAAAELSKDPLSKVKQNVEEKKAVLVDVREKKEWDAGHVR